MTEKATYKDAGVDLDSYRDAMARLPRLLDRTRTPGMIPLAGGFAGLFQLQNEASARKYEDPVLVSCTDGVGTKLKLAGATGVHNTVGIDLVAMSINDAICCGADPLFFLDYVAMPKDDPSLLEQIVEGIVTGCQRAGCALLGGETAIMPDLYAQGDYDLAGFCVGVVERSEMIDGKAITPGDVVLGVASSGLHSNGFSLARKIVFEMAKLSVDDAVDQIGGTVGAVLLEPTLIYAKPVGELLGKLSEDGSRLQLHGIAHITGGGLHENIERLLPEGVHVQIQRDSWNIPPVFTWLHGLGRVDREEMDRVFNMGLGLALILDASIADQAKEIFGGHGLANWTIGQVVAGERGVSWLGDA